MVQPFSENVVPRTICGDPTERESNSTTKNRGTAPPVVETNTSDRENFREVFLGQDFDHDTVDILMARWRKGTFSNYSLYISKLVKFASCKKVSPVEPPVQIALAFLTSLVREEKSFDEICMARSVLSSVINQQQSVSFGNILIVKRNMKGIFENNPTLPKFQFTWNVSLLFNYFRNMQDIHALDIQKLTQKLVMLMTLISARQRVQTIHSIRVSDIKILDSKVVKPIMSLIKQTKPTKHMAPLCFQIYNREPKLCVVNQLTEYLKRTKSYRDRDKLFLTFIKPYSATSKDTISRWCKCIVKESCISIHSYTSHSSSAAASSYPKTRGASLCTIIHSAGWKSERTFGQFYEKQIEEEFEFQNYLLKENSTCKS